MGMVNQDREFGVFILLRLRQLPFVYWASSYNINSFDQLMMANGTRLRRRHGAGLTMVPVVNFIVMPSAMAGATAMWVEELSS